MQLDLLFQIAGVGILTTVVASVLATVHGTALAETANRPALSPLFSRRCFDLYVLLSSEGGGKITALHDRCGSPIPLS